ncbi:MAG: metalloregulator ArsR/SmtB family transcription factor [Patescibacteria group bacterium]
MKNGDSSEKDLVKIFKALANKRRLAILKYLKNKKVASVGNIAEYLKLSFTSTSKHLNILYNADILEKEQIGLQIFYKISNTLSHIVRYTISVF